MARVTEKIDLAVPVEQAYARWTRLESLPEFLDFVESVTKIDDTRSHWKVRIRGAEREFDAVMEQRPNESITWTSVGGDETHNGIVTFDALSDASCRVTVKLDWVAEGLVEKTGAIFGVDDHVVKKDLRKFKELMEGRASGVTD